jgi:SseB protein N-terminal domain
VSDADSGGIPWAGRDLPTGAFAGDDGRADPGLMRAVQRYADGAGSVLDVVEALRTARVFVAIVASADDAADLALVTVTAPDRRRLLPVFTSPQALAGWNDAARPVPVAAPRAALSAVEEGCDLLALDAGDPWHVEVPRPAVWAIARGLPWTPSYADEQVAAEISTICAALGVQSRCEAGEGAELRILVGVPGGLDQSAVDDLVTRLGHGLAHSALVADRVDSIELTVLPS